MSQSDTNVVVLCGRLTRDAEAVGQDGSIAKFRLAVNSRVKQGEEWGEQAHFFDVTKFKAGGLVPHLTKGKQVNVVGRLEFREWETDGQKRNAVGVVANDLTFVGGKSPDSEAAAPAPDPEPDWVNDGAPE